MKLLRYSIVLFCSILLISVQSLLGLGMSPLMFKNVGACFKPGFEMYAPQFGSMALSSGFIENLRFYNVIAGPDDQAGNRRYVKDKALKDDPIMEILLILFPSPAGQLTVEGAAETNFGKLCTEEDVATLFNFVYAIRERLITKKAHLPKDLNKMLKEINDPEKQIETLRSKFDKANIDKLLLNIAKALEHERSNDRELNKKLSKEEGKQEEGENEGEQVAPMLKRPFYPKYMAEQIIGAFFCHKYALQENLRKLLLAVHNNIVYKGKITKIKRLLNENDLAPALENIKNGSPSLDDIWIALHRVNFSLQILPYKNNQNPISNGNAQMYDRGSDQLIKSTFPDCVEVSIRHIMNFIFFNSATKQFDLSKLDTFMEGKDQSYIQNLKDFYNYQTPDLANSGDSHVRFLWNKVVADLGSNIVYRRKMGDENPQNNNELDTGMLNVVRVFERIFNLDLGDDPIFEVGKEEEFKKLVQNRALNCFKKLFEGLCSQEIECDIVFSDIEIFKRSNAHDLSGNLAFAIIEENSKNKLFSFTIRVLGGENLNGHVDIQSLQINDKSEQELNQNECESITQKLNVLSKDQYSSSLFLADDLVKHYENKLNEIYQIFSKTLNDTEGKLYSLDQCHDVSENVDVKRVELIVANIMRSYLWDDEDSLLKLYKKIFDEFKIDEFGDLRNQWKNEKFKKYVQQKMERIDSSNQDITEFDVSGFPILKELDLGYCYALKELKGKSVMLKKLHLRSGKIESFDISDFPMLKNLSLRCCHKLKDLHLGTKILDTLSISGASIKQLDLSQCIGLKSLRIGECPNIELIVLPSTLLKYRINSLLRRDQIKKIEQDFPGKVKIVTVESEQEATF